VENEYGNPFAECGVHRHQPLVQAQDNRWESDFKLDNPELNGGLDANLNDMPLRPNNNIGI
jgi:hypothetical protein